MTRSLEEAKAAIKKGNTRKGYELLARVINDHPHDSTGEIAWLWMSTIFDEREKKRECFEAVLQINPTNEYALEMLEEMGFSPPSRIQAKSTRSAANSHERFDVEELEVICSLLVRQRPLHLFPVLEALFTSIDAEVKSIPREDIAAGRGKYTTEELTRMANLVIPLVERRMEMQAEQSARNPRPPDWPTLMGALGNALSTTSSATDVKWGGVAKEMERLMSKWEKKLANASSKEEKQYIRLRLQSLYKHLKDSELRN